MVSPMDVESELVYHRKYGFNKTPKSKSPKSKSPKKSPPKYKKENQLENLN